MSMNNPAGTPATGDGQQQPGANQQQPQSQGPNDVIQPPATGGQQGQPATGTQQEPSRQQQNYDEMVARLVRERDEARREVEAEKRKGLTEEERKRLEALDKTNAEQTATLRKMVLRYEVAAKAPALGIIDAETAVLLLEQSGKVTVADDLTVTGVEEALKDLIKSKPYLAAKTTVPPVDGGAGTGGQRAGGKETMNDLIRRKARGG